MKRWFITPSTNIMFDTEKDSIEHVCSRYTSLSDCYIAPCDCKIKFADSSGDTGKEIEVKEGQLVCTFYRRDLPNPIIILDSNEFTENIKFIVEQEQKEKEEWAANKKDRKCVCKSESAN